MEEVLILHTLSLSNRNAGGSSRIVIMEPWGREFVLDMDKELEVPPGPVRQTGPFAWWRPINAR